MPLLAAIGRQVLVSSIGALLVYLGLGIPTPTPAEYGEALQKTYDKAADSLPAILGSGATTTHETGGVVTSESTRSTPTLKPKTVTSKQPSPLERITSITVTPPIVVSRPVVHPQPTPSQQSPIVSPTQTPVQQPVTQTNTQPNVVTPVSDEPETETPHNPHTQPADAVMRITCLKQDGLSISLSTASGVVIDETGVILTNAHVAYALTDDAGYECAASQANVPTLGFELELVFISPTWVKQFGAAAARGTLPTSTGENDVALVRMVRSTSAAVSMPSRFVFLDPSLAAAKKIKRDDDITTLGYPGVQTGNIIEDTKNAIVIDDTTINNTYSFGDSPVDLIETRETATAKRGSSGGAVLNEDGELIGLIGTTIGTSRPALMAVSMSHVDSVLKKQDSPFTFE